MIPKKYEHVVFPFLMALFMSCIMSFVISVMNAGFASNIVIIWLKAWMGAFVVAFPTILVVGPIVRRLTAKLIKQDSAQTGAGEVQSHK